jgi:hypothetical protein
LLEIRRVYADARYELRDNPILLTKHSQEQVLGVQSGVVVFVDEPGRILDYALGFHGKFLVIHNPIPTKMYEKVDIKSI